MFTCKEANCECLTINSNEPCNREDCWCDGCQAMMRTYKQGDWVIYNDKPRQVYRFLPFAPTETTPAVIADPRFDMVELFGIKSPIYTSRVQRMIIEEVSQ